MHLTFNGYFTKRTKPKMLLYGIYMAGRWFELFSFPFQSHHRTLKSISFWNQAKFYCPLEFCIAQCLHVKWQIDRNLKVNSEWRELYIRDDYRTWCNNAIHLFPFWWATSDYAEQEITIDLKIIKSEKNKKIDEMASQSICSSFALLQIYNFHGWALNAICSHTFEGLSQMEWLL